MRRPEGRHGHRWKQEGARRRDAGRGLDPVQFYILPGSSDSLKCFPEALL